MEAQFLTPLTSLENKVNALLYSITTSPSAAGAPAATTALIKADDDLTSALETLRTHQANYAKILNLRAEAEKLEEKIKGIVREIESAGKEISAACGDDGASDSDDSESENDDVDREMRDAMGAVIDRGGRKPRGKKEVDYKLLLDFARRISRYNNQAAADASAGTPAKKLQNQSEQSKGDGDVDMTGTTTTVNGQPGATKEGESGVGVASLTKDAAMWLDETANWTRDAYMIPYPNDDRIRMGLMGQLQIAAGDGGPDPEKEVEKLIREAEGGATGTGVPDANVAPGIALERPNEGSGGPGDGRGLSGSVAATGSRGAAKPKAKLDLDLYDPDDDDV
ncbi:hypothetical protein FQN54_004526 [Arachnomyces sp. PD_36]|nr:hypothetical protein FQN54_004526 [Arachnomyces sp. PD_36]